MCPKSSNHIFWLEMWIQDSSEDLGKVACDSTTLFSSGWATVKGQLKLHTEPPIALPWNWLFWPPNDSNAAEQRRAQGLYAGTMQHRGHLNVGNNSTPGRLSVGTAQHRGKSTLVQLNAGNNSTWGQLYTGTTEHRGQLTVGDISPWGTTQHRFDSPPGQL